MAFFGLFLCYGWFTGDIQLDFWSQREVFTARTFPYLIAVGGSVTALAYAINPAQSPVIVIDRRMVTFALVVVLLVAYSALIDLLGYPLSSSLMLLAGGFILGERRILPLLLVGVGVVGILWAMLWGLGIHIEPGPLGSLAR